MQKFFLSYAHSDESIAQVITDKLTANGKNKATFDDKIIAGSTWENYVQQAIQEADIFIALISDKYLISEFCYQELSFELSLAKSKALQILPIYLNNIKRQDLGELALQLATYPSLNCEENESAESVAKKIDQIFETQNTISKLYDQIYEYPDPTGFFGAAPYVEEIIDCIKQSPLYSEEQLITPYLRYGELGWQLYMDYNDPLCLVSTESYLMKGYEISKRLKGAEDKNTLRFQSLLSEIKDLKDRPNNTSQEDSNLYEKIANYNRSAVELFQELLKEDSSPAALDCLITSYHRLINYCRITGGLESIIKICEEQISGLKKQLDSAEKSYDHGSKTLLAFQNYLGKENPNQQNFDVFISFKSEDAQIAKHVYDYLRENGKKVFFSDVSLPEMGTSLYTKAIDEALDHSKHMVLIATDVNYLSTKWVEHEWEFFYGEKIEGRKDGEIILVLDDEISNDKGLFPPSLRHFQICRLSDFRRDIIDYLF